MEEHGEGNGSQEERVLPWRHCEEALVLTEAVSEREEERRGGGEWREEEGRGEERRGGEEGRGEEGRGEERRGGEGRRGGGGEGRMRGRRPCREVKRYVSSTHSKMQMTQFLPSAASAV